MGAGQGGNPVTTAELDRLTPRVPAASRIGQGTAIEQSRAVAEVEAQIVVAMRHPRNESAAIAAMRETCRRKDLAERAFFRYPKAGKPVSGPSIQLARELARVWGNISYGSAELRRDDEYGQSEMLAYAWDVQTNTRNSATIINPHRQYTGGGDLTELRDIQENNASVVNRRVREAIWAVLPAWFVEEAKDICAKTIADGGGIPLPQRIANAIEVFGNLGITTPQLEAKVGMPTAKWGDHDVAQLRVIRQSLLRGEISKDEEFPPERITAADILNPPAPAPAAAPVPDVAAPPAAAAGPSAEPPAPQADEPPPAPDEPAGPQEPAPADDEADLPHEFPAGPEHAAGAPAETANPGSSTKEQSDEIWEIFRDKFGFTRDDRAQMRQSCEQFADRKLVGGTIGNLSSDEADYILTLIRSAAGRGDLVALLAHKQKDGGQQ